ncbi:MAG: DUF705 domain-containing protein [Bacteroidota bacterium]
MSSFTSPPIVLVDVDDTLVRSAGAARIPMPEMIAAVRRLHASGAQLYCWSSGGAAYAQRSAEEVGLAECFLAFPPKPTALIDDVAITEWRHLQQVHPNEVGTLLDD